MKLPIYMDNHATTPLDPRVLEAMLPYLTNEFGNAASRGHIFGWRAQEAVEEARARVAALLGASPREIVFTSGATESNNLAIKGVAGFYRPKGDHIITSPVEHKAVLDPCKTLEADGFRVTYLPVSKEGSVDLEALSQAITPKTILVSIMWVNNEIGTINSLETIGRICQEKGVLFHCDAVQGLGKIPFDVKAIPVDLMSISGHKMYGPKGIGALFVRRKTPRVRLVAQIEGGGHERGLRSGTLNVPAIVGLGKAADLAGLEMDEERDRITLLRERLYRGITSRLPDVRLNGHPERRHPGNLNLSFAGVEGESLMMSMRDVAVSSGSACTSASTEPSYVLKAIGVDANLAHASIRFGLGRFNTEEEVDYVIERVIETVTHLRRISVGADEV